LRTGNRDRNRDLQARSQSRISSAGRARSRQHTRRLFLKTRLRLSFRSLITTVLLF
jgi:hypothetical protein